VGAGEPGTGSGDMAEARRPATRQAGGRSGAVGTGVDGLDDILMGGLPRHRLYLVQGDPGVGKTTLALQFLLEGRRQGERVLYIALSETRSEIEDVARSHGWSLEGIDVYELGSLSDFSQADNTLFHPEEVELHETMRTLLAEVDRVGPARVVFDSLSEVRLLAQNQLRYRRQILALKQYFAGRKCTVLLLDDRTGESSGESHLQSLSHGVISMEQRSPEFGTERRRLRVVKLRGLRFRAGYHDFTIQTGGLQVYPRLVAAEHRRPFAAGALQTGIRELDALAGGGLERGTATLVIGPAGSGKSALATLYAVAAAEAGERASLFLFDERLPTLLARTRSLGLDLEGHMRAGRIRVQQIDPAEMSPGEFVGAVRRAAERDAASVVVVDSLNGYLQAMPDERFLNIQMHELLTYLSQNGVSTILVMAQHGLVGTGMQSPVDMSYLADTVVLLRFFEAGGSIRKAISVLKKRSGGHESTLRELRLGPHGVAVGPPLAEFHGVLTGVPVYHGRPRDLLGDA
jgi:circadian clock protein KaiC